jgi:hypothetical protein
MLPKFAVATKEHYAVSDRETVNIVVDLCLCQECYDDSLQIRVENIEIKE